MSIINKNIHIVQFYITVSFEKLFKKMNEINKHIFCNRLSFLDFIGFHTKFRPYWLQHKWEVCIAHAVYKITYVFFTFTLHLDFNIKYWIWIRLEYLPESLYKVFIALGILIITESKITIKN